MHNSPPLTPGRVRSGSTAGFIIRSVLTGSALLLTLLPLVVAVGAFLPSLPALGRFGAVALTHLPALLAEATLAASLAVAAVVVGGGRLVKVVAGVATATAAAMLAVAAVTTVFAAQLGVSFDVFQMARAASAVPAADERVVFATVGGQDLHADIWHPKARLDAGERAPAVLYVHGGAFFSGYLGSRPDLFHAVATAGIVVVDVEYRLAPPPRWADAPGDVLCALGWMATHADQLGIDPTKIVVAGESAGGNLAMLAGYAAGTDQLPSSCGAAAVKPAGMFAVAPTADLAGIWSDFSIQALELPFPEAYIGGPPSEYPDRYDQASPLRLIRPDLPPTFLLTGANDHFVLLNRVTSVADRIRAAGAPVTLVVAPFADHGFDGFPNGYGNQLQSVLLPRFVLEVTGGRR